MNKFLIVLFILFSVFSYGEFKNFEEITPSYEINVKYPEIQTRRIEKTIKNFVEGIISDFKKVAKEEKISHNWKYSLYIRGKKYSWKNIESYYFQIYRFTGGAHGNTGIKTFIFDKEKKKFLDISDIVDKKEFEKIKKLVRETLYKKLSDSSSKKWIEEGTEKIADFKNFVLSGGKIIFFFPQYQVACYAAGIQKVEIPFPIR